jgi:hypothetical protein
VFRKNKTITFQPGSELTELLVEHPKPSSQHVPEWYKKQKLFSNNENDYFKAFKKRPFSGTYKMCTPLVDSLTSGYTLTLPTDIIVSNVGVDEYIPQINWLTSWDPLDEQAKEVLGNYPIPTGFYDKVYRWIGDWIIKTPPGYSLWVTHPSHRHDLPFFTLNSFIDTDSHPNSIVFPFFIKKGFEGIIERGTPFVQVIPIKRDSWKTKIKKFTVKDTIINSDNMNLMVSRVYKYTHWAKKKYE